MIKVNVHAATFSHARKEGQEIKEKERYGRKRGMAAKVISRKKKKICFQNGEQDG